MLVVASDFINRPPSSFRSEEGWRVFPPSLFRRTHSQNIPGFIYCSSREKSDRSTFAALLTTHSTGWRHRSQIFMLTHQAPLHFLCVLIGRRYVDDALVKIPFQCLRVQVRLAIVTFFRPPTTNCIISIRPHPHPLNVGRSFSSSAATTPSICSIHQVFSLFVNKCHRIPSNTVNHVHQSGKTS